MSAVRLAQVIPDLQVGGLQRMVVGLLGALDRDAFDPVVYTFDAGGPLEDELAAMEVAHVHLPRGEGVARGHAAVVAARFLEDGIELVHCHNVTALFHGARAARLAGRLPVLFTEHDREMPAPFRHRVLHRWLSRRATRTVAVSASLARDLVRYEGFRPETTGALVNGAPDPSERFDGGRAQAREELGWDRAPVVLAVGSLTPVKNHGGLLRIWKRVVDDPRSGGARLVLAGEGPLRGELEDARDALGLADRVELLGNRFDVPRLLAASDVFVLPSHREGLPLSLVEAHGMGRPSVAYDVGGNGEVLESGATGRLVAYPDEAAFAAALVELLDGPDLADRQGRAARVRYREHFTHAGMVSGYVALYGELLPGRIH